MIKNELKRKLKQLPLKEKYSSCLPSPLKILITAKLQFLKLQTVANTSFHQRGKLTALIDVCFISHKFMLIEVKSICYISNATIENSRKGLRILHFLLKTVIY